MLVMRGFALAFAFGSLVAAGPPRAVAQGFGQVKIADMPPPAAAQGKTAPTSADVSGVTVTGKRIPESQRDPNEVLCHDEIPIGSRFPVKVCATRRQYAERRQIDQELVYEWTQGKPFKSN
jgi:hypothetical protein